MPTLPRPPPRRAKITLDKRNPAVSLAKQTDYGTIRVNLNWNHAGATPQKSGFHSGLFNKNKGIDLDLGVFIRLQNGAATACRRLATASAASTARRMYA